MQNELTIILICIINSVMYICICNAVTEEHIQAALDKGARSLHDLQKTLKVGTQCGSCCSQTREMITAHHTSKAENEIKLFPSLIPQEPSAA